MSVRTLSPEPTAGTDTAFHPVLLRCRRRDWSLLPLLFHPTAQTSSGPTAATPSNELLRVPGFGLPTILQEVPSHRCMRVLREAAVREEPTAHALVLLRASTSVSVLYGSVATFGLDTKFHWVPSQCTTTVLYNPLCKE
jgi:hypothetical protein